MNNDRFPNGIPQIFVIRGSMYNNQTHCPLVQWLMAQTRSAEHMVRWALCLNGIVQHACLLCRPSAIAAASDVSNRLQVSGSTPRRLDSVGLNLVPRHMPYTSVPSLARACG